MSGRVRLTLADGRRVVGFRKTLRVNPRKPPAEAPVWELGFALPAHIGFTLPEGPTGVIGVHIGPPGYVFARGKNKSWVLGQSAKLLQQIAKNKVCPPISARLVRLAEAGPTLSGPSRPGAEQIITLNFDGRNAVVIEGTSMRPVIVP